MPLDMLLTILFYLNSIPIIEHKSRRFSLNLLPNTTLPFSWLIVHPPYFLKRSSRSSMVNYLWSWQISSIFRDSIADKSALALEIASVCSMIKRNSLQSRSSTELSSLDTGLAVSGISFMKNPLNSIFSLSVKYLRTA